MPFQRKHSVITSLDRARNLCFWFFFQCIFFYFYLPLSGLRHFNLTLANGTMSSLDFPWVYLLIIISCMYIYSLLCCQGDHQMGEKQKRKCPLRQISLSVRQVSISIFAFVLRRWYSCCGSSVYWELSVRVAKESIHIHTSHQRRLKNIWAIILLSVLNRYRAFLLVSP